MKRSLVSIDQLTIVQPRGFGAVKNGNFNSRDYSSSFEELIFIVIQAKAGSLEEGTIQDGIPVKL